MNKMIHLVKLVALIENLLHKMLKLKKPVTILAIDIPLNQTDPAKFKFANGTEHMITKTSVTLGSYYSIQSNKDSKTQICTRHKSCDCFHHFSQKELYSEDKG